MEFMSLLSYFSTHAVILLVRQFRLSHGSEKDIPFPYPFNICAKTDSSTNTPGSFFFSLSKVANSHEPEPG